MDLINIGDEEKERPILTNQNKLGKKIMSFVIPV
jgi:hypothetical protein